MTGLLGLVPQQTLQTLESRNLFAGHYMPDLKTSVAEAKKAHPEMQAMLDTVEEVQIPNLENPLAQSYGWYIPAKDHKPTVLHAMGNKSSLTSMLRYQPLTDEGFGFMAYEYPGYGRTLGKPSEERLYQSAVAASQFLSQQKGIPLENQIFHGVSLGGAVTTELASRNGGGKAVILESTMTSFPDVAKVKVESYAPAWLMPLHKITFSQMTSLDKMPAIKAPLLVLHGAKDSMMPKQFAEKLLENARTPNHQKKLVIFKSQGHNIDTGYSVPVIRQFLRELSSAPKAEP
ncbi:alpha/beta hydrolase [Vampirovibrio sp.]|uniref:alpha/beta hydrolase n=1 Tax=Vampirovibrio sp. TaxID=2717857 RepID=UPI0035938F1E